MALRLRHLTDEEHTKLERLTRAQSAPLRLVRRAQIIWLAAQGLTVPAIARQLGIGEKAVRQRLERFATAGLEGLEDAPRAGRPRTYDEQTYSRVIAKARALPPKPIDEQSAEGEVPPTCHWTLDRLQSELAKEGLSIKRSQIRRILKAEHIKWQQPRTWLESTDPDFAKKGDPRRALHGTTCGQYGDLPRRTRPHCRTALSRAKLERRRASPAFPSRLRALWL